MSAGDLSPQPSRRLRGAEILRDPLVSELLRKRLVAVLSTLQTDGSVHAVALWYAATDAGLVLATGSGSRKVRNLERDPRATVTLHDSRPGFEVCGASIAGHVEIVRGTEAVPLVELVHLRYVTEAGRALPALASDDVAIVLTPERAFTWDERGSAAAAVLRETGGALPLEPTSPAGARLQPGT
jgi:PPOX class probable F420-dependent enzyme